MRLLARLILAGAAAVTAWLLSGIVTIRAVDDPTRVGLLPGLHVLLVSLAVLLTLSAAVRRPERAAALVALACAASLPWWPVDWPPAVLLLAGPLGWAWFVGCLLAVVEVPRGGWWWWRARRVVADPVRAPRLVAGIVAALLAAAAIAGADGRPDGDELDYLMIAQSLVVDGDLRIEDNHRRFEYEAWYDGVLPPSYLQRGRDGEIYSVHAPGLAVLILPGYAAAGYAGAAATVAVVCALGAALVWRLAFLLTDSAAAAWMGTVAAAGAAPWFLHASLVFPDAPAAALVLVGLWPLLEPSRFAGPRMLWPALALVALPWMHTRFAVLAGGMGLALLAGTWTLTPLSRRSTRAWLLVPAVAGAAAWLGFFWIIYGTPDPSAPYGTYTQTAWRHVPTGLAGLLADQQFGLLATAPVLGLAIVGALRARALATTPAFDARDDEIARGTVVVAVVVTALAYTVLTASYRMWWGGLSAPARFLAPLVLPLGLLVAIGWRTLRTKTSQGSALVLLAISLMLTGVMAGVDGGRLGFNVRDGVARWAAWASPVVDLAAALPASHRDAPWLVVRDALMWILVAAAGWVFLRVSERHAALTRARVLGATLAVALVAPSAVWAVRQAQPWHPAPAQLAWLRADAGHAFGPPIPVTSVDGQPPQRRYDLRLQSSPSRHDDPYTALAIDGVPAGRYRLVATDLEAGTRLGVAVGRGRPTSFIAEAEAAGGRAVADVVLPMDVDRLVVRSSPRAPKGGRVWLQRDRLFTRESEGVPLLTAPATTAVRAGATTLFYQARGAFPEGDGAWLAGDADGVVGITGPPRMPVRFRVRAGAATVLLEARIGQQRQRLQLAPNEETTLEAGRLPGHGAQRLHFVVHGGFRPALVTGSDDGRRLGVWLAPDQNLTTPLR